MHSEADRGSDGHGARGSLRVLIGAAPGVGKTCAMLEEGARLKEEGVDVVVAVVETHGRAATAARVRGHEVIPRREVLHRGVAMQEMDLQAVLDRHPRVALVDELAHTDAPGSPHERRWQDVEALLAAGIDVITTVNVQHIESLADTVEQITGVIQRERIPDEVVRRADQIEVIDVTPRALRERLAAGVVYPPERVDAALSNYFRLGNLTALRELALLWLADEVDSALAAYRAENAIAARWDARERVVVAVTGGPESETLLRRGARIARRTAGGELIAVHVASADGLASPVAASLPRLEQLTAELGGTFRQVVGDSIPRTLLDVARSVNASQVVIGVSRRSGVARLLGRPAVGASIVRHSGEIDVHIVNHDRAGGAVRLPRSPRAIGRRRQLGGLALAVAGPLAVTALLAPVADDDSTAAVVLAYQILVVVATLVGGLWPAVLASLLSSLLIDYFFIAPIHTVTISAPWHLLAVVLSVVSGLLVALVVDRSAERARIARRRAAESDVLAGLTRAMLGAADPLAAGLERTREAFSARQVTVRRNGRELARVQAPPAPGSGRGRTGREVTDTVAVGEGAELELVSRPLDGADRLLLAAIADQLEGEIAREDLSATASSVAPLEEADRVRRALLAAVGHDLRRPLAAASASLAGLDDPAITSANDRAVLLATAREAVTSLTALVTDLLDVSRLQSGALGVSVEPTDVDAVVIAALDELDLGPEQVALALDAGLPAAAADPALLQRVLVNLLANAVRHSPAGRTVTLTSSSAGHRIQLRVIDHGPGVSSEDAARMFEPFQRLGDTDNTTGLGLGLAVSRGFTEGMGGSLEAEPTPGGGLTMCVELPAAIGEDEASGGSEAAGEDEAAGEGEATREMTGQNEGSEHARAAGR